jgi:hypothetical protein
MKLLSVIFVKDPCGSNFDPENAYRKPLVILKIVPEAGYYVSTGKSTNREKNLGQILGCGFRNNV